MAQPLPVTTRFAPSPSGALHPGNARTALFCWLAARSTDGRMILRLEDTDSERSDASAAESLMADLAWLGLDWDEGPDVGGEHEPYLQSARAEIHQEYLASLRSRRLVYPCFCSAETLAAQRKAQSEAGQPPRYPGTCRDLDGIEVQQRLEAGEAPVLRFRVPGGVDISFDDRVRGALSFRSDDIGDFVVSRSDDSAGFLLGNAVDDALMGVDLVLRGDDHIANTPRQILLLSAMGLEVPAYGHLPLVVDERGSPLSTRRGATSLAALRAAGYLPLALMNQLARLGHRYASEGLLSSSELREGFDLENVGRAAARFDPVQLDRWQHLAAQALDAHGLREHLASDALVERVPDGRLQSFLDVVGANVDRPAQALEWAEQLFGELEPDQAALAAIQDAGARFFDQAQDYLGPEAAYSDWVDTLRTTSGLKGKALFQPLRAALTGRLSGPELAPVYELLGRDRLLQRLHTAEELARRS